MAQVNTLESPRRKFRRLRVECERRNFSSTRAVARRSTLQRVATPPDSARPSPSADDVLRLRTTVLVVAALNFAYFFVEIGVALAIGSVSLFADSVDFLEDTAINLLIAIALGWSVGAQAIVGRALAVIILVPAIAAGWQAFEKFLDPVAPDPVAIGVTAGGAAVVNLIAALLIVRIRDRAGSLSRAAFLSARNDVLINAAIIAMAFVTAFTRSGWPDLALGLFIIALALHAAWEIWEAAGEERLAAKALAGEDFG